MRAVLLGLMLLGGCANEVRVSYSPSINVFRNGQPVISQVTATDQRGEEPTYLGTVRGGFGNPLKRLQTAEPVADEVAAAFVQGLQARGLRQQNGSGPYRLDLQVRKFDVEMLLSSTAQVSVDLAVTDTRTGQVVVKDTIGEQRSDSHVFATGVFANVEDLRKLAESALNATVDRVLDSYAFRKAIEGTQAGARLGS